MTIESKSKKITFPDTIQRIDSRKLRKLLLDDPKDGSRLAEEALSFDWSNGSVTPGELMNINFFFDPNYYDGALVPLTGHGEKRKLADVAQMYERLRGNPRFNQKLVNKVENLVDGFDPRKFKSPLLIVTGSNPLSNEKYFLDGNHRALAIALKHLRGEIETKRSLPALFGQVKLIDGINNAINRVFSGE